ncbi:MAG: PaaI family thioesterase [Desulfobacterales bacterium]|nr:PaaI family thioesterase [Desulfobacterales bacterium]
MLQPNPEYVRELIAAINASPFPAHMAMRLASIELDQAVVELKPARQHLQAYGIVHGGVLATLIDTATFWSVFLRSPEGAGLVNVDLKLNYLEPVVDGLLTAEGRAIRYGTTLCYAESNVRSANGDIVAHGTSTLMLLPGKVLTMKSKKFLNDPPARRRQRVRRPPADGIDGCSRP